MTADHNVPDRILPKSDQIHITGDFHFHIPKQAESIVSSLICGIITSDISMSNMFPSLLTPLENNKHNNYLYINIEL